MHSRQGLRGRLIYGEWLSSFCFLIAQVLFPSCAAAQSRPEQPLSVETIVSKLVAANQRRAQDLRSYTGKRQYQLDYRGFLGSHSAQLGVEVSYAAPETKNFRILSESGSKVMINRVLLRLLDSEKEAFQQRNRTHLELSLENYSFTLIGTRATDRGNSYILSVQPREKNKFLYSGKIWVDGTDFAVTRMEGEPAKNPSFWISRTQIEYSWVKIGKFWLPAHNRSVTQVRLGGTAILTLDYTDYQITDGHTGTKGGGDKSLFPDPSAVTPNQH